MQTQSAFTPDFDTLLELNREYIRSVQMSDVQRFREILADDFLCSQPDGSLIDRERFLELTALPVKISNLEAQDVNVRLMETSRSYTRALATPPMTGAPGPAATQTCGRVGTGNGWLFRRM